MRDLVFVLCEFALLDLARIPWINCCQQVAEVLPRIMPPRELSIGLFTDLYELTMAQAYWQSSKTARATFSLFFRNYPPDRAYFVFAGLADVLDYLENFRFSSADIALLRSLGKFDEGFMDYLSNLRFTGDVRAMPEGTIFFTNEPVIEVSGPVIEAQIVETFLLNQINAQTVLATKASRVVYAAHGKALVDFSARRTHGTDAANMTARLSYLVGYAGTSNTLAGGLYDIPTFGTMAHSFVTAFEDESESFRAYARSFPDASTFLVDTYEPIWGTRKAVEVALEMKRQGHSLRAVRLDSGDLPELSIKVRSILDKAGLSDVQIFASGGIDEYEVQELLKGGAPIDAFGIGTKAGVSADAPWADSAYKLVEFDGQPVLKLSAEKATLPGPKQVYRYRDATGIYQRDVIASAHEPPPSDGAEPLLTPVVESGTRIRSLPTIHELRLRFEREFECLPYRYKRLTPSRQYEVTISRAQDTLTRSVVRKMKQRATGARPVEP